MDREQAARAMGMKPREVVDVVEVPDGHAVTTHDGAVTLVTPEGECQPYQQPAGIAPAPATPATPAAPAVEVPDGSEQDVLTWVGDSTERAGLALVHETAKESPRKGLVAKLAKMLAA